MARSVSLASRLGGVRTRAAIAAAIKHDPLPTKKGESGPPAAVIQQASHFR